MREHIQARLRRIASGAVASHTFPQSYTPAERAAVHAAASQLGLQHVNQALGKATVVVVSNQAAPPAATAATAASAGPTSAAPASASEDVAEYRIIVGAAPVDGKNAYLPSDAAFRKRPYPALRGYFKQFGPLLDVYVPLDKGTGLEQGFGFVTFATPEAQAAAIRRSPHVICGSDPLSVRMAYVTKSREAVRSAWQAGGARMEEAEWRDHVRRAAEEDSPAAQGAAAAPPSSASSASASSPASPWTSLEVMLTECQVGTLMLREEKLRQESGCRDLSFDRLRKRDGHMSGACAPLAVGASTRDSSPLMRARGTAPQVEAVARFAQSFIDESIASFRAARFKTRGSSVPSEQYVAFLPLAPAADGTAGKAVLDLRPRVPLGIYPLEEGDWQCADCGNWVFSRKACLSRLCCDARAAKGVVPPSQAELDRKGLCADYFYTGVCRYQDRTGGLCSLKHVRGNIERRVAKYDLEPPRAPASAEPSPSAARARRVERSVSVPVGLVGGLIGKKGEAVNKMTEDSGALVQVGDAVPGRSGEESQKILLSAATDHQADECALWIATRVEDLHSSASEPEARRSLLALRPRLRQQVEALHKREMRTTRVTSTPRVT